MSFQDIVLLLFFPLASPTHPALPIPTLARHLSKDYPSAKKEIEKSPNNLNHSPLFSLRGVTYPALRTPLPHYPTFVPSLALKILTTHVQSPRQTLRPSPITVVRSP